MAAAGGVRFAARDCSGCRRLLQHLRRPGATAWASPSGGVRPRHAAATAVSVDCFKRHGGYGGHFAKTCQGGPIASKRSTIPVQSSGKYASDPSE
uniref:Uncharacterized protein n=1 Tax=Oryza barthii TaxID=65489 RepID=A0A0D3HDC0_9ORYZ